MILPKAKPIKPPTPNFVN